MNVPILDITQTEASLTLSASPQENKMMKNLMASTP